MVLMKRVECRECVETYGMVSGEPVVYATDSKNFHIFPNSMEITDEIKKSEEDLRLKVISILLNTAIIIKRLLML
ncbi:MAG: hypothetical protein ACLUZ6_04835 [Lachnospira eligens]